MLDREKHRERLARDLHDELGSNLGSIALISSFAQQDEADPQQLRADLKTIEQVSRESADSMRDMVALLHGDRRAEGGADFLSVMRALAGRALPACELECELSTAPLGWEPNLETRRELYLFCKKVLYNVARHAKAAHVGFYLSPVRDGLRVVIEDDGCGFDPAEASAGYGLENIRERAAIMKARLDMASAPGEGSRFVLEVPRARRWTRA